jgi:hypothetical protein
MANALANAIGVPPNRITAILKDERGITGDTAIRLGNFLKTSRSCQQRLLVDGPYSFALSLQADEYYDNTGCISSDYQHGKRNVN